MKFESRHATDTNTGKTIGDTQQIEFTDETGKTRQLSSTDELPPHIKELIEKARAQAVPGKSAITTEIRQVIKVFNSSTGHPVFSSPVDHPDPDVRKKLDSLLDQGGHRFVFCDAAGNEFAFDTLEQMPPEIRTIFERARGGQTDPGSSPS